MNIISLFSGAGGLDLGFILAGHKIVFSNDFDKAAYDSYIYNIEKFMPHKSYFGDITKYLDKDESGINDSIPDGDIVIGGFPCQGFTVANLNRSMDDERNQLYKELLKVISAKKPKYFLAENVKGLESMENGEILPLILNDFENCYTSKSKFFPSKKDVGYTVVYNVINAMSFGVPENRERVIILGIRNDIFNGTNLKKFISEKPLEKNRDIRKRLILPIYYSKKSNIVEESNPFDEINFLYNCFKNNKEIGKQKLKLNNKILYKYHTLRDAIGDLPNEYSNNILNHQGSKCLVNIKNKIGNRATNWDKYAPTIMGRGSGTGGPLIPPHPNKHRRLTVREVARIQTFPDNFYFCGSNSCGYRQIGNAVPVLMAFNIAKIFNED